MGESYRDLIAWRKAMDLVTDIYRVTQSFPRDELYGLTNQLRRAAVSVPSNIAEGQARFSRKEFHHFLSHARLVGGSRDTAHDCSEPRVFNSRSNRARVR